MCKIVKCWRLVKLNDFLHMIAWAESLTFIGSLIRIGFPPKRLVKVGTTLYGDDVTASVIFTLTS